MLNLTCKVTSASNISVPRFEIAIHTPYYSQNSMNRVLQNKGYNTVNIVVQNLQESDSGDYKCEAINDEEQMQFHLALLVIVKHKKCGPHFFQCLNGVCIMRRYLCDGFRDCRDGEDEYEEECGPNPCKSKLHCDDHRCIPIDWCCDTYHDSNCTVRVLPSCCLQLSKSIMDLDAYANEPPPQGLSDMGFLQNTLYTVVGCSMAFMFIVTILVVAICRVHMKRSLLLSRCSGARSGNRAPQQHHHHHGLQHMPLYDLDVRLNRSLYPHSSSVSPHTGLSVTYNINNGVQFMRRPMNPPPYCEIVASPPREGPPPPYISHENLPCAGPEARSIAHNSADDIPGERDSLLDSGRGLESIENTQLRGDSEYLNVLAGTVFISSQQPMQEVDRNCQVGNAISLTINSDHDAVLGPDTICSFGNDERVSELSVESGISCENLVVAPNVPDAHEITLNNVSVPDKSSAKTSTAVNTVSCTTHNDSSFSMVCDSQENPLHCLHDSFIMVHTNSADLNPRILGAATHLASVKSTDTSVPTLTLENYARTKTDSED
ncbi:uncharacterized protein LOC110838165 isoform X2 [Zootermopsis nevadensis]|nr:uncharacterized protein LOC110838165 isoform X2 [Zootermopsis nevadensis]